MNSYDHNSFSTALTYLTMSARQQCQGKNNIFWPKKFDEAQKPADWTILNEWRASENFPLCTQMMPFSPPFLSFATPLPEHARSLWQMGLIHLLKDDANSIGMLRTVLKKIFLLGDPAWGFFAEHLDNFLLKGLELYPLALKNCLTRFEILLNSAKSHTEKNEIATLLGCDLIAYSHALEHTDLEFTDAGNALLKTRISHHAKTLADKLQAHDADETVRPSMQWKSYIALMDGLLFLGNFETYQKIERCFTKAMPHRLKISVPLQKLWACFVTVYVEYRA